MNTTLPSTETRLAPATAEEIRTALKALFVQFVSQDGDSAGKMLGYIVALEGEPKWSIDRAVRQFLRGEVRSHDGRFLPTSAELARVARAESEHARKMADWDAKYGKRKVIYRSRDPIVSDYRGNFPTFDEFKRWQLPEGTQIIAADATVIYPNGAVEGWTSIQRRIRGVKRERSDVVDESGGLPHEDTQGFEESQSEGGTEMAGAVRARA